MKKDRNFKPRFKHYLRAFNIKRLRTLKPKENSQIHHICKNCGEGFEGNFCPRCGQDASSSSLKWIDIPKNILGAFFNIDGGFAPTLLHLFTRPGYLIKDFLQGKRARYFRPFQTLFVLAAIYILVAMVFNQDALNIEKNDTIQDVLSTSVSELNDSSDIEDSYSLHIETISKNIDSTFVDTLANQTDSHISVENTSESGLIAKALGMMKSVYNESKVFKIVLSIILMAFSCMLAFNRKVVGVRYNYVEHVFIMTYIEAQLLCLSILILPFNSVAHISSSSDLPIPLLFAIYCYDFKQLYGLKTKVVIWRTLLALLINFLINLSVMLLMLLYTVISL